MTTQNNNKCRNTNLMVDIGDIKNSNNKYIVELGNNINQHKTRLAPNSLSSLHINCPQKSKSEIIIDIFTLNKPMVIETETENKQQSIHIACRDWWDNRNQGNQDYTPPWIKLPWEYNNENEEEIFLTTRKNFENKTPVEYEN